MLDPASGMGFLSRSTENTVDVFDPHTLRIVQSIPVADGCKGPSGMAAYGPDHRVFIACSGSATLLVLDLDSFRTVEALPINRATDVLAYDPGLRRIDTAGAWGTMNVVQEDTPDRYHVATSIRTHFGDHTLAIDPDTHRVYVGDTSLLVQPPVAGLTLCRKGDTRRRTGGVVAMVTVEVSESPTIVRNVTPSS